MSDEADSKTYRENYRVLKETADWLAKPGETDIDELVPKIEAAMKAYRVCKERIESVRSKLNTYFEEDPAPAADGEAGADDEEDI
jgi:exodeoxyribonuclease VII small subunit